MASGSPLLHKPCVDDRYKKCGIICADVKCRYIPTRGEIREMKGRDVREGRCYACQGTVLVRESEVERRE